MSGVASPRSIEPHDAKPQGQPRLHVQARPRVIVAEARAETLGWLCDALDGEVALAILAQGQAVLDAVARGQVDLVILGHHLRDMSPAALLERLSGAAPGDPVTGQAAGDDPGPDTGPDTGHPVTNLAGVLCQRNAKQASRTAPAATGMKKKVQPRLSLTTISGSIPAGG